tara:strand:- start:60 stop:365 length:306 start_codon:yes stop_codon:yes gene_type:complete
MNQVQLQRLEEYYKASMSEKHRGFNDKLPLESFIDKYSHDLTMQDLYLGQSILNMQEMLEPVLLETKIEGLLEARDQCKCSEVYINERIQELEEEIEEEVQ